MALVDINRWLPNNGMIMPPPSARRSSTPAMSP